MAYRITIEEVIKKGSEEYLTYKEIYKQTVDQMDVKKFVSGLNFINHNE